MMTSRFSSSGSLTSLMVVIALFIFESNNTFALTVERLPDNMQLGPTLNAFNRVDSMKFTTRPSQYEKPSVWELFDSTFLVKRMWQSPYMIVDWGVAENLRDPNNPVVVPGAIAVSQKDELSNQWIDRGIYSSSKLGRLDNDLFGQDFVIINKRFLVTTSKSPSHQDGTAIIIFDMDRETMDKFVTPFQVLEFPEQRNIIIEARESQSFVVNGKNFVYDSDRLQFVKSDDSDQNDDGYDILSSIHTERNRVDNRSFANAQHMPFGDGSFIIGLDEENAVINFTDRQSGISATMMWNQPICHIYSTGERLFFSTPYQFAHEENNFTSILPGFYRIESSGFTLSKISSVERTNAILTNVTSILSQYSTNRHPFNQPMQFAHFSMQDMVGRNITHQQITGCDFIVDHNKATGSILVFSESGHFANIAKLTRNYPGISFGDRINGSVTAPTLSPTMSPTMSPTLTPTIDPTESPTLTPTESPTLIPPETSPPTNDNNSTQDERRILIATADTAFWSGAYLIKVGRQTSIQIDTVVALDPNSTIQGEGWFTPSYTNPMVFGSDDTVVSSAMSMVYVWTSANSYREPSKVLNINITSMTTSRHYKHLNTNPYRQGLVEGSLRCRAPVISDFCLGTYTYAPRITGLPENLACGDEKHGCVTCIAVLGRTHICKESSDVTQYAYVLPMTKVPLNANKNRYSIIIETQENSWMIYED